jgi:hypothetical protein
MLRLKSLLQGINFEQPGVPRTNLEVDEWLIEKGFDAWMESCTKCGIAFNPTNIKRARNIFRADLKKIRRIMDPKA